MLQAYLDALVAGDPARIADSFATDAIWWLHGDLPVSGMRRGRAAILDFLATGGSFYAPGTQHFTFGAIIADGDAAVLEWQLTGTAAATGKPYDNEYCAVFGTRDGRIAEVRESLDSRQVADPLFAPAPA